MPSKREMLVEVVMTSGPTIITTVPYTRLETLMNRIDNGAKFVAFGDVWVHLDHVLAVREVRYEETE